MNWILSLAVITSSAIFIDCNPSEPPFDPSTLISFDSSTCIEGTSWMDDCNECTCVNGLPTCTQMACPPRPARDSGKDRKKREVTVDDVIKYQLFHREKREVTIDDVIKHEVEKYEKCSAGTVWNSNCVHCECGDDGPHCNAIDGCTPGPIITYKTTCNDGDKWKEDCNHCWCNKGIPACTRKLCDSHPHYPMTFPPSAEEEQDGQEKHVAKREASTACKPGDTWMDDCNQCTCNKEGKASCSRKLCEKDHPEEIPWLFDQEQHHDSKREAPCKPGTVWIKMTDNDEGCAKFTCHADGSVTSVPHFTREMCPSEPQYIEDDDDQQHHVSKRDADGVIIRSLRKRRAVPPPSGCQPGESYFDGCNTCVCSASGPPACTYKICPPDSEIQTVNFNQIPGLSASS